MSHRLALTGEYGDWVVLGTVRRRGKTAVRCRCACGRERVVRASHLFTGVSRSCGGPGHRRIAAGVRSRGQGLRLGDQAARIDATASAHQNSNQRPPLEKPSRTAVGARTTELHIEQGKAQDFSGEGLLGQDRAERRNHLKRARVGRPCWREYQSASGRCGCLRRGGVGRACGDEQRLALLARPGVSGAAGRRRR